MNYFQMGGLITERDKFSENQNLFLAQYLTLGGSIQREYFESGMRDRQLKSGLYKRSPIHNNRSVSQDEILGFMVSSKRLGTNHRFIIWNQLVDHCGAYPAVIENKLDYLPFNLSNYYVWGKLANKNWTSIFAPLYAVNLLINTLKEPKNTSSKILNWVELSNIDSPLFKWFFEKRMEAMYGPHWVASLLLIYHRGESEDFPIKKQLKEYYGTK
jgi:hypothetical protein